MLVVHIRHVELAEGAGCGAPAKARITCGKCPDYGLWFSPLVAETQEVLPGKAAAGGKQRASFDATFGFPWHAYLEPTVHLSLRRKASLCCGLWPASKSVAGVEFGLPFRDGEPGRDTRELQLLGGGGAVLGRAEVELELRRVSCEELHERFDLLLADPDRYLHERDYLFPDKIAPMAPGEAPARGTEAAGSAGEEAGGGVTPTLLGRTASNSPKARRRHFDAAKLRPDE